MVARDTSAREDAAALEKADEYLATYIVPLGWEVVDMGQSESAIRGRPTRQAIVRRAGIERVIVWDRGLQKYLAATDLEGTRWGIFDPYLV